MTSKLTPEQYNVLRLKHTEAPWSGEYNHCTDPGVYTCAGCGEELFDSKSKFDSGCGWPAFDAALPGKVKESADEETKRTEITCVKCGGHLGHKFVGERGPESVRHCVNSVALELRRSAEEKVGGGYEGKYFQAVEPMEHHTKTPDVSEVSEIQAKKEAENWLTELIGTSFVGHDGKEVTFDGETNLVCIYFSASWCPPCKKFTPVLSRWYSSLVAAKKSIMIIFASRDTTKESFQKYFDQMSFPLAFPMGDKRIDELLEKYGVGGIPSLVVLDKTGKRVDKDEDDACDDVATLGVAAYDKFVRS